MSSSPHFERSRCFGIRAVRPYALLAVVLLAAVGGLSCEDEISPPTLGTVQISLTSENPGGAEDAQLFWDDSLLVRSTEQPSFEFHLPPGQHRFRLVKPCSEILPAEERTLDVQVGKSHSLDWSIALAQGIEVTASMSGADIYLDGDATGQKTPATLACVPPGKHRIAVRLLGATAGADSSQEVVVGDEPAQVDFSLTPLPQTRMALLELFTATLCPNCPVADRAADFLWEDPTLVESGYVGLEVHTRWGGTDPFNNASITERNGVFRNTDSGNPLAIVNGLDQIIGTGNRPYDEVAADYRASAETFLGTASKIAFQWHGAFHAPGQEFSGSVRVLPLAPLSEMGTDDPARIEIWALYYKDRLPWHHPIKGDVDYRRVVREYQKLGSFADLGLDGPLDWTDIAFGFSLEEDQEWSEATMGLVVFATNIDTKEILQVAHLPPP